MPVIQVFLAYEKMTGRGNPPDTSPNAKKYDPSIKFQAIKNWKVVQKYRDRLYENPITPGIWEVGEVELILFYPTYELSLYIMKSV